MTPPSFLSASLLVALGGGIGAWFRFLAGRIAGMGAWPWATLGVNLVGSFAMGLLAGWLARQGPGGEQWRLLLAVGVLGGFTTFSAFSLELAQMIERGSLGGAAVYAVASVVGGLIGLFAGLALTRAAA